MNVTILALEGCMPSAVIGIGDVLAIANKAIEIRGGDLRFRCRVVSLDGGDVRIGRRLTIAVDSSVADAAASDIVIVPGFLVDPKTAAARISKAGEATAWLRRRHAEGCVIGAFCMGVFVLAEAGLLDGRRATTTWWLQSELRERYPKIDLALDAVVTETDNIVCAAGPMSWVDLVLRLIEMVAGAETARACADFAVLDTGRRTQAAYLPQGYLLKRHSWLVEVEMLVRRSGSEPVTVGSLASALGLSERSLHRKIRALAGEPPQSFIARIRMEMARTLLETTVQSVKEIAHTVGYEDESSFRKAFRKLVAMNPREYRLKKALPRDRAVTSTTDADHARRQSRSA